MDTKSYTSFIPKSSMPTAVVRTHSSINLFFAVTFIIFLLAVGASVGLYIYEKALKGQIASINKELNDAKKKLNEGDINTWKRLDDRIKQSERLMQNHIATSMLFKLLEDQTMRKIQLTNLSFSKDDAKGMNVTIKGITDSYSTLALQADVLGTEAVSRYLKDAIISDVTLDDKGRVSFGMSAVINPGLLSYEELIRALSDTNTPTPTMPTSTTPVSPTPPGALPSLPALPTVPNR